jgi:hypothetical protein
MQALGRRINSPDLIFRKLKGRRFGPLALRLASEAAKGFDNVRS